MRLLGVENWLRTPANRDIIARRTVGYRDGATPTEGGIANWYRLELPPSFHEADSWEFVALGDTGDSDASGPALSPQDAVAQQMAQDSALPDKQGKGQASLVLHMGDVIYMTGERRLYDRNFRRPYKDYLTPESTVDNFVFRLPFLPVPGNHDYYDLGGWAVWLSNVPYVGAGLKALMHQLFAFSMPEGGSDMGRAYMDVFVDGAANPEASLAYTPGERTRLPNRYYRFRRGSVDFWALDSNTLDAPAPETHSPSEVRQAAAERTQQLEAGARDIDARLRREQRVLDAWRQEQREAVASDPAQRATLIERTAPVVAAIATLRTALEAVTVPEALACRTRALDEVVVVGRRWEEGASDLTSASSVRETADALRALEDASDEGCSALRTLEMCLGLLPEGTERSAVLGARDEMDKRLDAWAALVTPPPPDVTERLRALSEEALDIQRELSQERRRVRYRPEDYDAVQLRWLDEGLAATRAERPDGWRIVYLHHPPYTTIGNHCEHRDVINLRENLMPVLQKHDVHLVLAGHAHGFEWFRTEALPNTGVFVTGGGGQITLRPSILARRRFSRYRDRYDSLRAAGIQEMAVGGAGPVASDGEDGPIYHYVRVEVTPEALRVRPVGVRRLSAGGFRREDPMPVYHIPSFPGTRPLLLSRVMEGVEIRRGEPPRPIWR